MSSPPSVLDLGMAPGGFSAAALEKCPSALICGISLPAPDGGHEIRIPNWESNPNINIDFADVTLFASEMGVSSSSIPASHPDFAKFIHTPLLPEHHDFDIAICGAQPSHMHSRAEYRVGREHFRLRISQLVLAMRRLRQGGPLVVLLRRADSWETAVFLRSLGSFSKSLELFKGTGAHSKRSTFYAVAQGVDVKGGPAKRAVKVWKGWWRVCTLGSDEECKALFEVKDNEVEELVQGFGKRLLQLGAPVWKIQANSLGRAIEEEEKEKRRFMGGWYGKGAWGEQRSKSH